MTLRLLLPPSVGEARARARAELLDQSLRADLAEPVSVEVARDYGDLATRASLGEAHIVWLPPTLCAQLESTLRGLFKCIRQGRTTYRSAIVARRGSVMSLGDLRQRRAAWVDPLSVGGHLLAVAALRDAGVPQTELSEQRFVGSYPEALNALLAGEVEFTALTVRDDSTAAVRDSLATYGGRGAAEQLASVYVTAESPNDAIGLTRALDDKRAERLSTRVLERDGSRARAALCLALDAEGFLRARPGEYGALREMIQDR
ncbi:MAG: PhnD/SsuA/transferrin family substrate-binding protein [Sandaracinaceae bacterium]